MRTQMGLISVVVFTAIAALTVSSPVPGASSGPSPTGLYTFDASRLELKPLIPGGQERQDVSWSPDGRWIASSNTTDFTVDVVSPTGGVRRAFDSISWSPNGSKVAYTNRKGLFVGASNWTKARLVSSDPGGDPTWAADGSAFAFGGRSPGSWLQVSRSDGTGVRRLWTPPSDGPGASWIDAVSWSPNGRRLALWATINNGVAKRNGGEFVYLVRPDRAGAHRISFRPDLTLGLDTTLSWSGDGQWLILTSDIAMFRLKPGGGSVQSLCRRCPAATLSPTRNQVAFAQDGGLWLVNVDGSGRRRIGDVPAATEISWSGDGRTLGLTLREHDDDLGRIAVADLDANGIRSVTDGNQNEEMIGLSSTGTYAAFMRMSPPSLWIVPVTGGSPHLAMTLATDKQLGPCPQVAWSPTAPVLAIANAPCEPS
jgi:Tol biopolymer transport system component